MKYLLSFIACIWILSVAGQTGQPVRIRLEGEIKDQLQHPVSYAHILSKSANEGWISDYYGKYRIDAVAGDTLIVTAISFHRMLIPVPKEPYATGPMDIILKSDTVNLKELTIRPWPATYEDLKRAFLKVEIDDPVADLDLHLPSPEELKMASYSLEGGFGVRLSLISMLYNKYSKEARSDEAYALLMKKDNAAKRYNKTVVSRVTGLKTDDELDRFMAFCALQVDFILQSTDYELYAAILSCYHDYCAPGIIPDEPGK